LARIRLSVAVILRFPGEQLAKSPNFANRGNAMKTPPNNLEFIRFTDAMRGILKVSKTELDRRLAIEKTEKQKAKPSASHPSRVSGVASRRAN